ncbi:hypothetical protein PLEOSDRAFT_1107687 [Pleurotus ostreatus PC15]|uniref:RecQ-mediated genome instability protein 1 n=1 Tax=Pleurotus ostreatus (strain PC15) TaxID=1137138 RepID=A0A067NMD7_PLEO1|nr:hypothetical protein PLEOSDRAFT_1107687 [Pleurotus ostreatus PC15]
MPVPPAVTNWLRTTFPRPQVDPVWLEDCYEWLQSEAPQPLTTPEVINGIRNQLLFSGLSDSMVRGTGFPPDIGEMQGTRLPGRPILVEIVQIEEIGLSALSLQKTLESRLERAAAGETEEGDPLEDDGIGEVGGRIPKYKRSMLKLHLSDGHVVIPAIEYRPLPELELGVTTLGYKLQLKDALVRGGTVFLEPATVTLLGHSNAELDAMRDEILARSLRFRLGQPDLQPPAPQLDDEMARAAHPPNTRPIVPLPARASLGGAQPVPVNPRPALRDVTKDLPPAARPSTNLNNNNDDEPPHWRKLPGSRQRTSISDTSGGSIFPSARQSTQDTLAQLTQSQPADIPSKSTLAPVRSMESPYFTSASNSTAASTSDAKAIQASFHLTPTRAAATLVSDNFEGNMLGHTLWSASLRDSPRTDIAQSKDKGKARDVVHETPFVIYEDSKADMSSDFGDTLDPIYLEAFDEVDRHASHSLAPSSQPPNQSEIITIESDEEDEKENAPSAPRHVRRRMGTSPVRSQSTAVEHLGIVEISDSD